MIGLRLNPLGDHATNVITTPMYEPLGFWIPLDRRTEIVLPDGRRFIVEANVEAETKGESDARCMVSHSRRTERSRHMRRFNLLDMGVDRSVFSWRSIGLALAVIFEAVFDERRQLYEPIRLDEWAYTGEGSVP